MQSKYRNKKIEFNGIKFDSKKEMNRYKELKILERAGLIKNLKLQPAFILIPSFKKNGKTYRKTSYIADFQYYDTKQEKIIVEDVKSKATAKDKVYRLKIKMFLFRYNLDFKEII